MAAAVLVALAVSADGSALAVSHPTVRVGWEPVERAYGPIPANNAVTAINDSLGLRWYPDECETVAAAVCDTIPIEIAATRRSVRQLSELLLTLTVSWTDPSGSNNLDVILWDDQQIKRARGDNGYTRLITNVSDANPEVVQLVDPAFGRYNLTVTNTLGANSGYRLRATLVEIPIEPPTEARPSGFSHGVPLGSAAVLRLGRQPLAMLEPVASPFAVSGPVHAGSAAPARPGAELVVADDSDARFASALRRPPERRAALPPAHPPSAVELAAWLGIGPIVAAVAFTHLARRRSVARWL